MFVKGDLITVDHNLKGYPYFSVYPGKGIRPIDMIGLIDKNETILVIEVSTNCRKEKVLKCLKEEKIKYISDITESETTLYNLRIDLCLKKVK